MPFIKLLLFSKTPAQNWRLLLSMSAPAIADSENIAATLTQMCSTSDRRLSIDPSDVSPARFRPAIR